MCEVSGRDVKAAVQEIKNIVQEGRDRDADGGGTNDGATTGDRSAKPFGARPSPDAVATFRGAAPGQRVPPRHRRQRLAMRVRLGELRAPRRVFPMSRPAAAREGGAERDADAEPRASERGRRGSRRPVSRALSRERRGGGHGGDEGAAQGHAGDGFEAFVKYLPHDATESEVASFFASSFGALRGGDSGSGVRLLRDAATGR